MYVRSIALLFLMAMLAWAWPAHAAQSYDNCTGFITSIPTVISTQGTWCLKSDLATAISSGEAITINTNNVTIDCNDFKLGGLAGGAATTATGISANSRLNATVRHCNIRGFYYGIELFGSSAGGHVIEDNRLSGNTAGGISVDGDGSVIRRNQVFDTGGSLVATDALGIRALYAVDVLDNTVTGVAPRVGSGGNAYGILMLSDVGGSVSGNRLRNLLKDGAGVTYGISAYSSTLAIHDNDLVGANDGFGLNCPTATNAARDNMILYFSTAISGCVDGGNTVLP